MPILTISVQSFMEESPWTRAETTTVNPRKAKTYSGRAGRPMIRVTLGHSRTVMSRHCRGVRGGR
jgi:hypothetical protein